MNHNIIDKFIEGTVVINAIVIGNNIGYKYRWILYNDKEALLINIPILLYNNGSVKAWTLKVERD